jgi:hypothetical protein
MKRAFAIATAVAGVGFLLGAGAVAVFGMRAAPTPVATPATIEPVWTEAKWPFPIDEWGVGKAFVCMPADCSVKVDLYVRPKIGYCNCATGVSDDAELERVSDTGLLSAKPRARGRARPVKVGWMEGLSRPYWSSDAEAGAGLLSVAYNDECDVVVALATFGNGDPAVIEPAVVDFLKSNPMVLWAKKELGLEFVRREW